MPIFHDPDDPPPHKSTKGDESFDTFKMRKVSEESIRTEFCEGPLLEQGYNKEQETPAPAPASPSVSDRLELIERIKRGESPTWVPNRPLESRFQLSQQDGRDFTREAPALQEASLLSLESRNTENSREGFNSDFLNSPAEIERPRSALHAGDFTEANSQHRQRQTLFAQSEAKATDRNLYSSSPTTPWYRPPIKDESNTGGSFYAIPLGRHTGQDAARSRAPSLSSYSSSFVLKAPTSPLVQTSNNDDLDFSPTSEGFNLSSINNQNSRRHTLPHRVSNTSSFPSTPGPLIPNFSKPLPAVRREHSFPYQAHQPRRSITTAFSSTPRTPSSVTSRRPSFSSDFSPLHHAPMVGSYEESILRGRMSTTPSKPLDFMAQIGVLGLGKCKSSLRCPAHVSLPFPAVFYSYGNTPVGRRVANDGPSPYVGLIDLENSLDPPQDARDEKRRRRRMSPSPGPGDEDTGMDIPESFREIGGTSDFDRRKREKKMRRLATPRAPPGGSYRIPQKGQIQIIIKNPNKTAVKLFLIPYDLEGMEAGTKTFIRQRSYSAGPIIEQPISSKPNTALDQNATQAPSPPDLNERPTLRYLIHLHICCPSRGRFYLYKSIRVVFANRVPDGKEKLRNEIQLPEPRYSTYKPNRDSHNPGSFSLGSSLAAQKSYRRRSSGFALSPGRYDTLDGIGKIVDTNFRGTSSFPHQNVSSPQRAIQSIPFTLADLTRKPQSQNSLQDTNARMEIDSPVLPSSQSQNPAGSLKSPPRPQTSSTDYSDVSSNGAYDKLSKNDVGYGGQAFEMGRNGKTDGGEGLLAKRLRGLDVQKAKINEKSGW